MKDNKSEIEICEGDCEFCVPYESKFCEGGKLSPVKKKIVSKYYPPELTAIKLLVGEQVETREELSGLSEEELIKFKEDIVKSLTKLEKERRRTAKWQLLGLFLA